MESNIKFNVSDMSDLICVELPCFVKSDEIAFQTVGGKDNIHKTLENDKLIPQFRFPSKDLTRHNVLGNHVSKTGLIIKIRRKKYDPDSDPPVVQIIGRVVKSVVFNEPADYNFLATSTDPKFYESSNQAILEVLPQSFCRSSVHGHQFLSFTDNLKIPAALVGPSIFKNFPGREVQNVGDDEDKALTAAELAEKRRKEKRHPDQGMTAFMRFADAIPEAHPNGEYPARWKKESHPGREMIRQLKRLFSVLPMLTKHQVEGLLDVKPQSPLLKDSLPYVCYCCSQGPFKGLWILYGYDPKQHPESRFFQTVTFRLSPIVFQDASKKLYDYVGSSRAGSQVVDLDSNSVREISAARELGITGKTQYGKMPFAMYGMVVKHQLSLQVFLMGDEQVFSFVRRMKPQIECTERSGWFTDSAVSSLRHLVLKVMSDKINAFLAQPEPIFVRGTILNPYMQAHVEDFDPSEVAEFLRGEAAADQAQEPMVEGVDPADLHPNYMLWWLRRYLHCCDAHSASEPSQNKNYFDEEPVYEVPDSDEDAPPARKDAQGTRGSGAASASKAAKAREQRTSAHRGATSVQSFTPAPVNFHSVQAFDVFGEEEEQEQEEEEYSEGDDQEGHEEQEEQYFDAMSVEPGVLPESYLQQVDDNYDSFMSLVSSARKK